MLSAQPGRTGCPNCRPSGSRGTSGQLAARSQSGLPLGGVHLPLVRLDLRSDAIVDVRDVLRADPLHLVEDLGEAVCTAGVDREGNWIRVYPVAFRDLPLDRRFRKYQWVRARFCAAMFPRLKSTSCCAKKLGPNFSTNFSRHFGSPYSSRQFR